MKGGTVAAPEIVHVTQPTAGGTARCVSLLAAAQRRAGLDVVVVSPHDDAFVQDLVASGVRHIPWPAVRSNGPHLAMEYRTLRAALASAEVNMQTAIHLHSSKAGLIGRLLVRGRQRTIFQPHGWSFNGTTGVERRLAKSWERIATRWSHRIVAVSADEQRIGTSLGVAAGPSAGRMVVVPNGVPVPQEPTSDEQRRVARVELGIGSGPTVVCIGRLTPAKGQDTLIRAWPSLLEQVPDAHLYLVGDGELRDEMLGLGSPQVTFLGWREDVISWLHAADVVAAPSRWDGMSLAVLEAMAAGRSVVASTAPGMRQALVDDGPAAGCSVSLDDGGADFVTALVERLTDPVLASNEGITGWQRVVERFSVEQWTRDLTALALPAHRMASAPGVPQQHDADLTRTRQEVDA